MPSLPPSSAFTASTVSEAQFKTAISTQREFLAGLLGTDGTPAAARVQLGVPDSPASNAGTQTIYLPAASLTSRQGSDGATLATLDLAGNATVVPVLEFDPATTQYAQFSVRMPEGWDETSGFTAQFIWAHPAAATNFGVAWSVRAKAVIDGGALDGAWSIPVQVNDTGGVTDTLYRSAISASVTPAGTRSPGCVIAFEFARVAGDATNDTLAVVARLLGVVIQYQSSSLSDA